MRPTQWDQLEFKNNMLNVTKMFHIRQFFVKISPYDTHNCKYTNDMAFLHRELNYISSKIMLKRFLFISAIIFGYSNWVMEEEVRDWKDKFDLKFNNKVYGNLDDSSGEGNNSIDD